MMYDVIIIGAGIIGCACARACADAGLRVAIIEQDLPGGATTAAGMGHVVVMDDSPAQWALTRYSRSLWQQCKAELPPAVEYEARGTLWVAADDDEMAEVHLKHRTCQGAGVGSMVLSGSELAAEEPNLRPNLAGALLVSDDAVVYPPTAATYFLQQAQANGAVLLRGRSVTRAGDGSVALADGQILRTGAIVLATGTDTSLAPWLPVQKRKGHLLITDRYPGVLNHQVVELGYLQSAHKLAADSVACNIQPRKTGQLLIGSSRQYGNCDSAVDTQLFRHMLQRACLYMPMLAHASGIRAWTGFRAATPDKLPLIGPTADPTVFVSVGFEGLGITNAPGAAEILADHLLGRPSSIDTAPYLPARLALKEPAHA
jgi:glycine/D-amino acid oxidase-like deaminating enzyme